MDTLREHPRPGSSSNGAMVAAPLSHGSNPNSNAAGRRREDDENLVSSHATQDPIHHHHHTPALSSESSGAIAFAWQQGDDSKHGTDGRGRSWITRAGDYTGALSRSRHDAVSGPEVGVRRLTPVECERLQALPDNWTAPDELGGPADYELKRNIWRPLPGGVPDSGRYAALGDAVTASVAEWIGRRLIKVDAA